MIREQAMRVGNADMLDGVYTDDYAYHGGMSRQEGSCLNDGRKAPDAY